MSLFKVQLNNSLQGRMDIDPSTNSVFSVSLQRSIYVPGPNGVHRQLMDGEEFEDNNYWKQFAHPAMSYEEAFLVVLEDDGSVWSSDPTENVVLKGRTVEVTTSYDDTEVDFVETYGGAAYFLQIQNLDEGSVKLYLQLNNDEDIEVVIGAGESLSFDDGDIIVNSMKMKGSSSLDANWLAKIRVESTT